MHVTDCDGGYKFIIMSEFKRQGQWGCFLFRDFSHFFTPSEVMDYYLGKANGISLQHALSLLEQGQYSLNPLLAIFAFVFDLTKKDPPSLQTSSANMRELINNDGAKLLLCGIDRVLSKLNEKQGASLQNEMALKVLLNIIYVTVDYLELNSTNNESSRQLNQLYIDAKTDDSLMRMVTLSLEAHYIPIKKLTMLYAKVLSNLFHHGTPPSSRIHPHYLFSLQSIACLPNDNLLRYGQLERYKTTHPPPTGPVTIGVNSKKVSPVEHFYRRHNSGECPLAQSIVVGLLRSLLTVCNCQAHKRFQTVRGSGVDSFREWQLSYRFLLDRPQLHSALPQEAISHLKTYQNFDLLSAEGRQPKAEQQLIWGQFYSHKIYTTAAIAGFFQLLLVALHENMFLQYSYFLQLISDANGILVFLKFLTDKFSGLQNVRSGSPFSRGGQAPGEFREEVMLTVYAVLLMLYTSCNNYPEKVRSYLFEYNSYLIIKKIPSLFLAREDEGAGMPSREEIDRLPAGLSSTVTMRRLTELCYDLLKIQIPLFSKKIKENSANMRVIIDIYCKYPQKREPRTLTKLDKLLLKSKSTKPEKFIVSVQEMKAVHNEYNNLYYWSNDFINEQPPSQPQSPSFIPVEKFDSLIDAEAWLQENLWKYYD